MRIRAKKLDPKELVTLEERALSTMWEVEALIELLHEKGLVTKQELLDKITDLRRQQKQAMQWHPSECLGFAP